MIQPRMRVLGVLLLVGAWRTLAAEPGAPMTTPTDPACFAIRALKPLHCARGPKRCERCRTAQAQPARPSLLDLCPKNPEAARPVVELERAGKAQFFAYDVVKVFTDEAEARAYAKAHGITDVVLP